MTDRKPPQNAAEFWSSVGPDCLPFADEKVEGRLPWRRLVRLSLFQITFGMVMVLLTGTLNRVMILELSVPAWLVASMVALPLVFAPFRALIGHRSDTHKSLLGWRRGPYIWFGSLLQFGGLAIMPFALLVLSGDGNGFEWVGQIFAALAFLMIGAGMHTTQTAGLALATDLAPEADRPRVVALLYIALLVGMAISAIIFSLLLVAYSHLKLIQLIQGAAVVTMVLNLIALWKQEGRNKKLTDPQKPRVPFSQAWQKFSTVPGAKRLLAATGIGAAGFSMQDILLEPYGGDVLAMSISATTLLTALFAIGAIVGFIIAARALGRNAEPHRLAALGMMAGITAFSLVICAGALAVNWMFMLGVGFIGFGGGLFSVSVLTALMALADKEHAGIALGAWGAVQATCTGLAIGVGGAIRDIVASLGDAGLLGIAMATPAASYGVVYHLEILLLFIGLVAIGPLVKHTRPAAANSSGKLELHAFPQ